MKYTIKHVVYPDGDFQEISHPLKINQLVDINGYPLSLPLQSSKVIAYEVYSIQRKNTRNEEITEYHLELVSRYELEEYVTKGYNTKATSDF